MRRTGPGSSPRPRDHAPGALVLAVLLVLPATVLAGCIAEPSTELSLRRGDLARVELVASNATGLAFPPDADATSASELCGAPVETLSECPSASRAYVVRSELPAERPDGWQEARSLPEPLIETLSGLTEGDTVTQTDLPVFGAYREDLVEAHPLETSVPRVVDDATAYGRTWNTTELEDGRHRIEPGTDTNGTPLEIERWCNQRFCLFESELVGYNATHLVVRHAASESDAVDVPELDTALRVTRVEDGTFWVDGNPPRAGERYDVFARIVDIRGPPEGQRRAPGFDLTTVNGTRVTLEDLLDRPVVIEFFATWCPSCIKNTEHLNRLVDRFGDRVNIISIGVDPWESSTALESFIEANDVTWPVAVDEQGRVSQAYHVGSLSTEVLVSPAGAIVHTETGVADHERVVAVLEDVLAEAGHDHGAHEHPEGAAP